MVTKSSWVVSGARISFLSLELKLDFRIIQFLVRSKYELYMQIPVNVTGVSDLFFMPC